MNWKTMAGHLVDSMFSNYINSSRNLLRILSRKRNLLRILGQFIHMANWYGAVFLNPRWIVLWSGLTMNWSIG